MSKTTKKLPKTLLVIFRSENLTLNPNPNRNRNNHKHVCCSW